jgi:hypothetical protein
MPSHCDPSNMRRLPVDRGRLAKEIMPVTIPATKKTPAQLAEHDEFIRDDTTAEVLAALWAQPGTTQMTAANSSPLSDGASAVVIASGKRASELGGEPLARVVSSAVYGIDPSLWAWPLHGRSRPRSAGHDLIPSRSTCGRCTRRSAPRR